MWLLVRASAQRSATDGDTVLAACPDSPEREDAWRWTVSRVVDEDGRWQVRTSVDETHVQSHLETYTGEPVRLDRAAGEEVVVVPLEGSHHIAHQDGPWQRWLDPGDVFVVEGDDTEDLHLTSAPGDARVAVVRLRSRNGRALRWVP